MRENGSSLISTSSCYQILWQMMRTGFANICTSASSENAMYYDSTYSNFLWTVYLLNVSTAFFSTDRLPFYYFRPLALQIISYIQVSSIILALCANSRLCCTQFFAPVTQNMWRFASETQTCKSATPAEAGREIEDSHTRQLTDSLEVSPFSTRSRYSCLISRSRRDGRPGYMVEPPDSTMCL